MRIGVSLTHDVCIFHRIGDMLPSSTGHHSFHYGPPFGHHHGDHFGHHGDFFPSIHEEYYYVPPEHQEHEEEYHKPSYSKGKGHDLSVKDFFEIALTALAFLAFGLFIIQLMMNAVFEFSFKNYYKLLSESTTSFQRKFKADFITRNCA